MGGGGVSFCDVLSMKIKWLFPQSCHTGLCGSHRAAGKELVFFQIFPGFLNSFSLNLTHSTPCHLLGPQNQPTFTPHHLNRTKRHNFQPEPTHIDTHTQYTEGVTVAGPVFVSFNYWNISSFLPFEMNMMTGRCYSPLWRLALLITLKDTVML